MTPTDILLPSERQVLERALAGPLTDRDPQSCVLHARLAARGLLQLAGAIATANGWDGPQDAYLLTRRGWAVVKAERRPAPILRAG